MKVNQNIGIGKKVIQFIPNLLTLGNLFLGCIALILLLGASDLHEIRGAFIPGDETFSLEIASRYNLIITCILGAMLLDFFDGFIARKLGVQSNIGVQLDSLADMVTFGVVPSMLLFWLFRYYSQYAYANSVKFLPTILGLLCLFVALGACYRLAKFNIQDDTSSYFKGLATPAMTLFVIGFFHFFFYNATNTFPLKALGKTITITQGIIISISIILPLLMVSNIPLFSLKVKNLSWRDNWYRYLLVFTSLLLIPFLGLNAFFIIIPIYILLSLVARKSFTN